jgi:hypothetical protein
MLVGVTILVIGGVAAGLAVWLTGGAKSSPAPSHRAFAALYHRAVIRKTRIGVLEEWPPPYQTFHDQYQHRCFQWWDKPVALYVLCFKNGLLIDKAIE